MIIKKIYLKKFKFNLHHYRKNKIIFFNLMKIKKINKINNSNFNLI